MGRNSRLARKERRAHKHQQESLLSNSSPAELGAIQKVTKCSAESSIQLPIDPPEQSRRSKVRQCLREKVFKDGFIIAPKVDIHGVTVTKFHTEDDRLEYWTDASHMSTSYGIGISYPCYKEGWVNISWRVRKSVPTYILRIYALAKSLETAFLHYHRMEEGLRSAVKKVVIYSTCEDSVRHFHRASHNLTLLKKIPNWDEVVGPAILAAKKLDESMVKVELRCVSKYAEILGKEMAKNAARIGAMHELPSEWRWKYLTPAPCLGNYEGKERSLREELYFDVMTLLQSELQERSAPIPTPTPWPIWPTHLTLHTRLP
jgi:hypothetical protein